ncbi:chaplin family protein [Actinoplanes solisilvae]|uniref:chaplin family protein n=1 Tax=Actinoplanes solisilvae TaxID=2486853 RepID=UPI000FD90E17|nr:chaplin family protein [Actinoplanes solisilvae]
MKTWVRKTLSVGVLAAGALLFAPGAANADVRQTTGGNYGFLNGTQIAVPVKVPVNVVGNSLGILGVADARGVGVNHIEENGRRGGNGPTQVSGQNFGLLNGTQAYLPVTVPVNIVGNAASVAGVASASGTGVNRTESGKQGGHDWNEGPTQLSGQNFGLGNGTQIYAPIDVPINACGNSLAILGASYANAVCSNDLHSHRSHRFARKQESVGHRRGDSQVSGQNFGALNGTQLLAPISLPVNLAGNSASVLGVASSRAVAVNESTRDDDVSQVSGQNFGLLNGSQLAVPINVPINVCGNSLGVLGAAQSAAACANGDRDGRGFGFDRDRDRDRDGHGHGRPGHDGDFGGDDWDGDDWDGDHGDVDDDDAYKGNGGSKGNGNTKDDDDKNDGDVRGQKDYGQPTDVEPDAVGSDSGADGGRDDATEEASPISDLTETVSGVGSLGLLNTLR